MPSRKSVSKVASATAPKVAPATARKSVSKVTPAAAPKVAPATAPKVASATASKVAPATALKVAPAAASKIVPATTPKVAPATAPKVAPAAASKIVSATTPKIASATAPKVAPAAASKIVSATTPKVAPATASKVAPAAASKIVPATAPKVAPATASKIVPATTPEVAPDAAFKVAPDAAFKVAPDAASKIIADAASDVAPDAASKTAEQIELEKKAAIFAEHSFLADLVKNGNLPPDFHETVAALPTSVQRFDKMYDFLKDHLDEACAIYSHKSDDLAYGLLKEGLKCELEGKLMDAMAYYTRSLGYALSLELIARVHGKRGEILYRWGMGTQAVIEFGRARKHGLQVQIEKAILNEMAMHQLDLKYHTTMPAIVAGGRNKKIPSATYKVKMKNTREFGRHLVAARHIDIGEVIMIEEPYDFVMNRDDFCHCHHCCILCYNPIPCNHCCTKFYCGYPCKAKAEVYHKYECFIWRATLSSSEDVLAFKMTFNMRIFFGDMKPFQNRDNVYFADKASFTKHNSVYRSDRYNEVYNLEHDLKKLSSDVLINKIIFRAVQIYFVLNKYTEFFALYANSTDTLNDFKRLLMVNRCIVQFHYRGMIETTHIQGQPFLGRSLAAGLHPASALFNHSCNPNVAEVSYGRANVVFAIRSIKPGEQLFTSYTTRYDVQPKKEREDFLLSRFNFRCKCEACVEDWPQPDEARLKNEKNKFLFSVLQSRDYKFVRESYDKCLEAVKEEEKQIVQVPSGDFFIASKAFRLCALIKANFRAPMAILNPPLT